MSDHIIRAAPNQAFNALVRYVHTLAQGSRVQLDTSRYPYAVRVDADTYQRWLDSLPKPPAPATPPTDDATAPVVDAAPAEQPPAERTVVSTPDIADVPDVAALPDDTDVDTGAGVDAVEPVAKTTTTRRRATSKRKRSASQEEA